MRSGSKGVPNKNLREMHGKPLMAYTISHALESELFNHVVVSTDSDEIAESAKSFGAETWFLRPADLADDTSPKIPVIRHAFLEAEKHYGYQFDIAVDLDTTSPLRNVEDINKAYKQFINDNAEILISVCPARKNPYFNMVEKIGDRIQIVKENNILLTRRQDAPKVYDMNASIYIWRRQALLKNDTLFTDKTSFFIMPEERSVDIDTAQDWTFVEFMMSKISRNQ